MSLLSGPRSLVPVQALWSACVIIGLDSEKWLADFVFWQVRV